MQASVESLETTPLDEHNIKLLDLVSLFFFFVSFEKNKIDPYEII